MVNHCITVVRGEKYFPKPLTSSTLLLPILYFLYPCILLAWERELFFTLFPYPCLTVSNTV